MFLSLSLSLPCYKYLLRRFSTETETRKSKRGEENRAIILRALCYMYKNLYYVTKDTVKLAEYGNIIIAMRNYVQFVINR